MTNEAKPKRGFAAMTPEQRAAISRLGGKAAHAAGSAHEFSSDEAKRAGSKGGKALAERLRREAAENAKG